MNLGVLVGAPGVPLEGPSGASAHVRELLTALRQDHDVRCFAAQRVDRRGQHSLPVEAHIGGAPGWPSWLESWRDMVEIRASRRVAHLAIESAFEQPFDGVIERHTLFSDAGARVNKRTGVPWVLEVNAPPVLERQRFEQLRRPGWAERWQREVLLGAPVIATVSTWLVTWLEELGCQNVHHVPNGVPEFVGDRDRGARLLGCDGPAVGFLGSARPWHGTEVLAEVAKHHEVVTIGATSVPGIRSVGFLEGQDLADAVAALGVGLAPYPADAPPWFCPLKVLQYRAQGTPVVATDVGDCRALVGDGGVVVPPGDGSALLNAVGDLMGQRREPWRRTWRQVGAELLSLMGTA